MFLLIFAFLGAAVLACFLVFAARLWRADGDLLLMSKQLKGDYFKNKVVWVTGASSGIGEGLAIALSKLGAKLILSSRTHRRLEDVHKRLHDPSQARVLPLDLGKPESLADITEQAVSLFGHVDILINNGGISQRGIHEDFMLETERWIMEVDFFGQIALTKALIPAFIKNGSGHIVNVSSTAGKVALPGRTIYSAAKFALMGYMDALRMELFGLGHKIPVTNICPGPVATNVDRNALRGDGSFHNKVDPLIAEGMKVERCAELSLIAISNQLDEVWVVANPILLDTYINQYCPVIALRLFRGRAKEMVASILARTRDKTE